MGMQKCFKSAFFLFLLTASRGRLLWLPLVVQKPLRKRGLLLTSFLISVNTFQSLWPQSLVYHVATLWLTSCYSMSMRSDPPWLITAKILSSNLQDGSSLKNGWHYVSNSHLLYTVCSHSKPEYRAVIDYTLATVVRFQFWWTKMFSVKDFSSECCTKGCVSLF